MKHIRYSLMGAHYHHGIADHPQKVMKELGITYQHATPQSMGDQWWFWNCENVPNFMTDLNLDPMECIGNGLSFTDAEKIRDYLPPLECAE